MWSGAPLVPHVTVRDIVMRLLVALLLLSLGTSFSVQGQIVQGPAIITPAAPTPSDVIFVQVYLPQYHVRTQSHSVSGNTVTVTIVNDAPTILPLPGSVTESVGPLPSGTYTFVIVVLPDTQPIATIAGVVVAPSNNVADSLVIRPAQPTSSASIQIDVPVFVCLHSDPLALVRNSSMTVSGKTISIVVDLVVFACFSAGDPGVSKPITFVLQQLPFGDYTINYARSGGGIVNHLESATFTVSAASPTDIVPIEGMWWDPMQSGSGYAIDVKHGVLVMTVFSYTATGLAQWYLLYGTLVNNSVTAKLLKFMGGQCISCAAWQIPSAAGDDGVATVTFTSPMTATILLPGGRITQIVPQDF